MTHQLPQFAADLGALRRRLLDMASDVEHILHHALAGLSAGDPTCLQQVLDGHRAIGLSHVAIDEQCLHMLALYQPVASDLRMVVATLRISAHLERTSGLAVNIGQASHQYLQHPPVKPLIDVPRMGRIVLAMLRQSVGAFTAGDATLAGLVLSQEEWLHGLKEQILRELLTYMLSEPRTIEPATHLLLIAQHIERAGDHAANVAEDVVFMVDGRDIRHRRHAPPPAGVRERRSRRIMPLM